MKNEDERANQVRLLNPGEVAQILGISMRKLWRMVADGHFPESVQVGKRGTRWRHSDITSYINNL